MATDRGGKSDTRQRRAFQKLAREEILGFTGNITDQTGTVYRVVNGRILSSVPGLFGQLDFSVAAQSGELVTAGIL